MVAALPLDVGPSATPHDPDGCLTEAQTSSTPDGTVPNDLGELEVAAWRRLRPPHRPAPLAGRACKQVVTGSSPVSGLLKPPANGGFVRSTSPARCRSGQRVTTHRAAPQNKEPVQVRWTGSERDEAQTTLTAGGHPGVGSCPQRRRALSRNPRFARDSVAPHAHTPPWCVVTPRNRAR